MNDLRYEEYSYAEKPFTIYFNVKKNEFNYNSQMNWHDDLEIQFCNFGKGTVLLDGEKYELTDENVIVVNPNVIHSTYSKTDLVYTAVIINNSFCKIMDIDILSLCFTPFIKDEKLISLLKALKDTSTEEMAFEKAKANLQILEIIIYLAEHYSILKDTSTHKAKSFKRVRDVIKYIRKNFSDKITLDEVAKYVCADKYALSRDFKKLTGYTIIEYLNFYRCGQATNLIKSGYSVSEAAYLCGFNNLSFFTKTYKEHTGVLPSVAKNNI